MTSIITNRYQIISELGSGGMGTVYKAEDTHSKQMVAIKRLKPEISTAEALERFQREGEALRDLNHPNIVKMLDAAENDGAHYLVMEYVAGGDLKDLLQAGQLTIEHCLKLALDLADALTRAHKLDIIHRDLKPANVLIAEDGTLRLTDFGVARMGQREHITAVDKIVGTVDYLAPEALDDTGIDSRADIWAFGVMLFEMLAGKHPFKGATITHTLYAITNQPPPDLESLRPDAPVVLIDLIYRMLEKDPQQRIPSVRYVGAELETILHGNHSAPNLHSPAPSATTTIHHNLPMQLTNFVGRVNELAELAQLLQQDNVRLVTIVAQGGMGKSRLALEAARQNLDMFSDGVYFIELAPLSEPESIVQVLIDAVRCPFVPDEKRSRTEQLVEFLGEKHLLLVMDNFEHLIAGANIITEILSATTKVRILVTSRQRLNQSNESLFQLEAMRYPDWLTPQDATNYDAFQLFVQSAQRIQPDFELSGDSLDNVARICQGVQGLPLGIVLAASWLRMLSTQEIVTEMQQSFGFLETEMSDVPERQRSIRRVFEYSWQLMTAKEQQILMALSVFRGGFTREAAAEVCQAGLRDLMGLMNKSLISRDSSTGRYNIHELLRQYAAEQLKQSGQQASVFDAHKNYFAQWMKAREGEITYRRQQAALDDIEIDFENVRLAWERAVQQKDYAKLNAMVEALHLFSDMRIRYDTAHKLLQAALDITPITERLYYRLIFRAVRLSLLGDFSNYQSNVNSLQLGQMQAERHQDNDELGFGLLLEGTSIQSGEQSDILFEKALSLLAADSFHRAEALARWGENLVRRDYELSHKLLNEAIMLHREQGNIHELAWTLGSLIRLLRNHLLFTQAEQYIEEALDYSQLIRHPHAESQILNEAAYLSRYKGEFEKTWAIAENSYNLTSQAHRLQLTATVLRLQIKYLLHEPVADILSELTTLMHNAKGMHPWYERFPSRTAQGAFIHSLEGDDAAARRAWQADIIETSPAKWLDIIAMEAVGHTSVGYDEFAVVLVGHLATYGDDAVGWLKRWSRYQEALSLLQSRLDEATYKTAFTRGQALTLDEMVQELKIRTGMV